MDQQLQRQILRQLKLLNFWITLFGVVGIVTMVILGVLLFKLITFVQDTTSKVETLQKTAEKNLNLRNQLCSDGTAKRLFGSSLCEDR